VVHEQKIRELQAGNVTCTGVPEYAAIRPLTSDGTSGQRKEIVFFPTPDEIYKIWYKYEKLTNALTVANPYPLGGMRHGQTIIDFCKWKAEQIVNGISGGPEYQNAMISLQASIARDSKGDGAIKNLGYNGDNSDSMFSDRYIRRSYVTYEGEMPAES
jgi:hypothetical protein